MNWIIFIVTAIVSALVQSNLQRKINAASKVRMNGGLTGADVARRMLAENGIHDVQVRMTGGVLSDHYNPATKVVNLSHDVYESNSVAAAAIAAHECGHAVQHAVHYGPLRLRTALVPVVSFSSRFVMWIILAGLFLLNTRPEILAIGIGLFALTTLFSFITLPVEVNASMRAIEWLDNHRITDQYTTPVAKSALHAAAYTYVAAALGSLASLLYYISIFQRRD